jgi:hypothetical protein
MPFSYFDTITTLISSTSISSDASNIHYCFFQIVKDRQPIQPSYRPDWLNRQWQSLTRDSPCLIESREPLPLVIGGGRRDRTDDPLLAKQVLSQLSYAPQPQTSLPQATASGDCPSWLPPAPDNVVGLVGFEPTTPALSRRCSNRLSYRPLSLSFYSR